SQPPGWYVIRNGQQAGPLTSDDLKRFAESGELGPEDLLWREGWTEWKAVKATPLVQVLALPMPQPPPVVSHHVEPPPAVSTIAQTSVDFSAKVTRRYKDGYAYARQMNAFGQFIKVISFVFYLGALGVLLGALNYGWYLGVLGLLLLVIGASIYGFGALC